VPSSKTNQTTQSQENCPAPQVVLDNRHLLRQLIVQALYEKDFHESSDKNLHQHRPDLVENLELDYVSSKLARKLRKGLERIEQITADINKHQKQIDKIISKLAPTWPLNQINPVDLQILRLAIYEGFINNEIPEKVAIDEAIELARDFGSENNVKFVSGVLGNLYADDKLKNELNKINGEPGL
jgi:N utilization substance protein B